MPERDAEAMQGLVTTLDGIAALFRVGKMTVAEWSRNGMPKQSHGKYSVSECVFWRRQRDLQNSRGGSSGEIEEERKRLIIEQRRSHEIDNAERLGELLPSEEVRTHMQALAAIIAGQLEAFPQRLAHRLASVSDPDIIRRMLRDECRQLRSAASQAWADYGVSLADGEDHQPASRPRRRAVGRRAASAATGVPGTGAVAD
jgi:phage terminase Nu1 subunit (DNA packaging protein)